MSFKKITFWSREMGVWVMEKNSPKNHILDNCCLNKTTSGHMLKKLKNNNIFQMCNLSIFNRLYLFGKSLYILKLPSQNTFISLENLWVDEAESCTKLWGQCGTLSKAFFSSCLYLRLFSYVFKGFQALTLA